MKPKSHPSVAAGVFTLGFLAAFAGCANAPLRQSTLETSDSSSTIADAGFTAPELIRTVAPSYPFDMKRAGIAGQVNVTCLVDATGQVRNPTIEYASHDAFISPSLQAVKQWSFRPAHRDGLPVATRVNVPLTYMFND